MLTLGAHDLFEGDDVLVVQPLQQLDLPDCCDWEALLLVVHPDFLQGHLLLGDHVSRQEHFTIGALPNRVPLVVAARAADGSKSATGFLSFIITVYPSVLSRKETFEWMQRLMSYDKGIFNAVACKNLL